MDVRIGVVQHTLLQAGFKNKESLNRDINTEVNKEKQKQYETLIWLNKTFLMHFALDLLTFNNFSCIKPS